VTTRKPSARSVLIIGSEAVPFAKTGGLADVLGALPLALARLGWSVTVALPRYRGITGGQPVDRFPVSVGAYTSDVGFYESPLAERVRALLIDCPGLFDRDQLYGVEGIDYPDNALRFALLVRAALEWAGRAERGPSIVHAHDWQAGLAPVYLRTRYASHPVLGGTPSVFTIHNLAYQGLFGADWLSHLDLPPDLLTIDRLEYWGRISLLKGGYPWKDPAFYSTNGYDYSNVSSQFVDETLGTPKQGLLPTKADASFEAPIIFISRVRTEPYDRIAGLMLEADDYLVSPYLPGELVARLL